jgi:hypothetical protein
MASMISDLLKTPQQVRDEQLNKLRALGQTNAQNALLSGRGGSAISGAISGLAAQGQSILPETMENAKRQGLLGLGGIAQSLGADGLGQSLQTAAVPAAERAAQAQQDAVKGADTATVAGLRTAAMKLRQAGNAPMAMKLEQMADAKEAAQADAQYKRDLLGVKKETSASTISLNKLKEKEIEIKNRMSGATSAAEAEKLALEAQKIKAQITKIEAETANLGKSSSSSLAPGTALGIGGEALSVINADPEASKIYTQAMNAYTDGNVKEARDLKDKALAMAYGAAGKKTDISEAKVYASVDKSLEPVNKLGFNVSTALKHLKEARAGNPKAGALLESTMGSFTGSNSVRAQKEIENLRSANSVPGWLADTASKLVSGNVTDATLEDYDRVVKTMKAMQFSLKSNVMQESVGQYALTPVLSSESKTSAFLSKFGIKGASQAKGDTEMPNGKWKITKDGKIAVAVNGKIYVGDL